MTLLTSHMTIIRQRIEVPIPRKHKGIPPSASQKATSKFYSQVYTAILKLLQLPALRVIILASPGFTKDGVYQFLQEEGIRRSEKLLIGNEQLRKFLRIHCSSSHLHSLMEVLRSPEVSSIGKRFLDRSFLLLLRNSRYKLD